MPASRQAGAGPVLPPPQSRRTCGRPRERRWCPGRAPRRQCLPGLRKPAATARAGARTLGLSATNLDAPVTSAPRMAAVTSSLPSKTRPSNQLISRPADSTSRTWSLARSAPDRSAAKVTTRYMAPVSRNCQPSLSARRRATELFPAPAGPSIVTTRGMVRARQSAGRNESSQPAYHFGAGPVQSRKAFRTRADRDLAPHPSFIRRPVNAAHRPPSTRRES